MITPLHPGERVVVTMERHPIIFFINAFIYIFLLAVPIGVWLLFQSTGSVIPSGPFITPLIVLATSIYCLYIWLYMLHTFFDFALDTWVVTNQRIINIEQKGLFSRQVAEQDIARIQDVTAEIKGILPTLFDFGNVSIQTAGEKERFLFKQIKNPQRIVEIISKLVERYVEENKIG